MKILIVLFLCFSVLADQDSVRVNPYAGYDKRPVLWLVGTCIGYGLVFVGTVAGQNLNVAGSGCIVLGVCVPLMVVKYVRHERYLAYEKGCQ